jgi:ankyrin repeat protein
MAVQWLIANDCDPAAFHNEPLILATIHGHEKTIKELLKSRNVNPLVNDGVLVNRLLRMSYTIAHSCIVGGHMCLLRNMHPALVRNNSVYDGVTLLQEACRQGNYHLVEFLAKSVDVNRVPSPAGSHPITMAASVGCFRSVEILYNRDEIVLDVPFLHSAVVGGAFLEISEFVFDKLPKRLLDATNPSDSDNTPLHVAVALSCVHSVKVLVEQGCNTRALNNGCETPLHIAVHNAVKIPSKRNENLEIIDILVANNGYRHTIFEEPGADCVELAISYDDPQILKSLLKSEFVVPSMVFHNSVNFMKNECFLIMLRAAMDPTLRENYPTEVQILEQRSNESKRKLTLVLDVLRSRGICEHDTIMEILQYQGDFIDEGINVEHCFYCDLHVLCQLRQFVKYYISTAKMETENQKQKKSKR